MYKVIQLKSINCIILVTLCIIGLFLRRHNKKDVLVRPTALAMVLIVCPPQQKNKSKYSTLSLYVGVYLCAVCDMNIKCIKMKFIDTRPDVPRCPVVPHHLSHTFLPASGFFLSCLSTVYCTMYNNNINVCLCIPLPHPRPRRP